MSKQIHAYYSICIDCGQQKARTLSPLCKRCGGIAAAVRMGRTGHTYAICQDCRQPKPRSQATRCKSCGVKHGAIDRARQSFMHEVVPYFSPEEMARRQREAHQCARMLRARIAARFPKGYPMNTASLREMFAPDREEVAS